MKALCRWKLGSGFVLHLIFQLPDYPITQLPNLTGGVKDEGALQMEVGFWFCFAFDFSITRLPDYSITKSDWG